ncbi:Dynamin family protein [Candidatus Magnetomoraceae bacterium gMMP-15]
MDKDTYQELRIKLIKQLDSLKAYREKLSQSDSLFYGSLPADVKRKIRLIDRDIARLNVKELKVAFVGGFSAGKSSIVNALLGSYILPESTEITTAVPTYVKVTSNDEYAEAHYLAMSEIRELDTLFRQELSRKFNEPEFENMPINEMLEALDKLTDTGRGKHLIDNFKLFQNEKDSYFNDSNLRKIAKISIEEAQSLVRNERQAMFLDKIVLYLKINIPEDVVLVDLPGVSVPNPRHRNLTFQFMSHEAHAVVFVLMASRLFDSDETEIIEEIREGDSFIKEKVFWVLNRWDSLSLYQKESTISNFEDKLREFEIAQEGLIYFKTNALHGLLSQMAISDESPSDTKIKEHMKEYLSNLDMLYDGDHKKALKESDIPLLRQKLFTFINNKIRKTTIETIIHNTISNFVKPLAYHLLRTKKTDEKYIKKGFNKEVHRKVRLKLEEQINKDKNKISDTLGQIRERVVKERGTIFDKETDELEGKLRKIIDNGEQTDTYRAYQDIIAHRKFRRYPYYFEIEINIVEKLNNLLKKEFLKIIRRHALNVYKELQENIKTLVSNLGSNIDFEPLVMSEIEAPLAEMQQRLESQITGVIEQKASLLDELLLYKPKGFFGFSGGNEIIDGLLEAAKYGTEHIKRADQRIEQEHMNSKTQKIRDTLKNHYIKKSLKFRDEVAEGFWEQIRNLMIDMEDDLKNKLNGDYTNRLEITLRKQIEENYDERQKGIKERTIRFKQNIEFLQKHGNSLINILNNKKDVPQQKNV